MVFLLSTPRAGSTLLRVMLAGHPDLFAPPELHLLPFKDLHERASQLGQSHLSEGLERALLELTHEQVTEVQAKVRQWETQRQPTQEVFATLQKLAGSRLLIDKSPSYVTHPDILQRAELLFDRPRYIQLVRHPYAVLESYVRMRMDRLLGSGEADPFALAEALWTQGNQNALDFLNGIDPERHLLVHYEALVTSPRLELQRICDFLGISFHEGLLTPYEGARMLDGLHAGSIPLNDPNFMSRDRIDASLADAWRSIRLPALLDESTRKIAHRLGYSLPHEEAALSEPGLDSPFGDMVESTVTSRGLQLAVCRWGETERPVVVCVHGLLEQGASWSLVAKTLERGGFQVIAPDQRGHGHSSHAGPGGSYHFQELVADLDAILRTIDHERLVLVGHSMGALVAAAYAAARPQRVAGLVLVESFIPGEEATGDPGQSLATYLDYLARPPVQPVLASLQAAAARLRAGAPALSESLALALARRHTHPATPDAPERVCWRWDPLLRTRAGLSAPSGRAQYLGLLRSLKAPVTLVYGAQSDFTRLEQVDPELSSLSGASRIVLPGGHNLQFDTPDALAAVILETARSSLLPHALPQAHPLEEA
jgi:pimeloyl-ACP methyl ester carboxylesterase